MKKMFVILSCFMVTPVFAGFITETTQMQWNSKVIEKALNDTGFTNTINTHHEIIDARNKILENLLKRETFSLLDAIKVCKEQCEKSDFLKNGRGQSGKKCPELCESLANNIVKVNKEKYTAIPDVSATSGEFSDLQGKAVEVCRRLMSDATTNGISYPVLCGGRCDRFGQDKVQITDLIKTKEYEVNDFCDNDEKGRDYFYILSDIQGAIDVSSLNTNQRIAKLKDIQTQPVVDYIKKEEERAQEAKKQEFENKHSSSINKYSAEVNEIGECLKGNLIAVDVPGGNHFKSFDCEKMVRDLALKCKCKATSGYSHKYELQTHLQGEQYKKYCYVGSDSKYHTSYIPNYADCVDRYGEEICNKDFQDSSLIKSSQQCQQEFREYYSQFKYK